MAIYHDTEDNLDKLYINTQKHKFGYFISQAILESCSVFLHIYFIEIHTYIYIHNILNTQQSQHT